MTSDRDKPRTSALALLLSVPLGTLAAVLARLTVLVPVWYAEFLDAHPTAARLFEAEGIQGLILTLTGALGLTAVILLASFLGGVLRRRTGTLTFLRIAYGAAYILGALYLFAVTRCTALLYENGLTLAEVKADRYRVFMWRWELLWPAFGALLVVAALHLLSWRRAALCLYSGVFTDEPAAGDRALERLRTHGRDPVFRKSAYGSVFLHLLVIVIIPWLLQFVGCVEDYRVPKGSGDPVVALVQIVQPERKETQKYILRPDAAIYFRVPDLDESEILKQVEKTSQLTYVADPNAHTGKMGRGGGKTGGWPDGMDKAVVRLIRLEYSGRNWDDGMDMRTRADMNFLEEFNRITGFKVADGPESHPIGHLARYRKGYAPPFVFMKGDADISIPARDVDILREYVLDGGMLVADCGSPQWDRAFRAFARQLFPDNPLRVIADDDPIFQYPFGFPHGAPPLWHHGGFSAMGIKHQGRWVVFYHPGEMSDAWKTGHTGLRPELAVGAFQMGINIIYYAFTNYLEATRKYRK